MEQISVQSCGGERDSARSEYSDHRLDIPERFCCELHSRLPDAFCDECDSGRVEQSVQRL